LYKNTSKQIGNTTSLQSLHQVENLPIHQFIAIHHILYLSKSSCYYDSWCVHISESLLVEQVNACWIRLSSERGWVWLWRQLKFLIIWRKRF